MEIYEEKCIEIWKSIYKRLKENMVDQEVLIAIENLELAATVSEEKDMENTNRKQHFLTGADMLWETIRILKTYYIDLPKTAVEISKLFDAAPETIEWKHDGTIVSNDNTMSLSSIARKDMEGFVNEAAEIIDDIEKSLKEIIENGNDK